MKYKQYSFSSLLYFFLLFCVFPICAQNIDQLNEKLQSVSKNNASDLVYLQTSKDIYETEEDLWFKGYVLDSQHFTPSGRSKILFVQLIEDKTDQVIWEKKHEIENGFVNGHLFLKNDLPEGIYTLAAYSTYSFDNNSKEFYSFKKIEIQKTIQNKTSLPSKEKDSSLFFNTFPEGGKLISGIQNTLAFKAVNSKGLPVNVSGILFENDSSLLHFKSSHMGMGNFSFTPNIHKKYHIELSEPISNKKYDITAIANTGKVLQLLSNTKDSVSFKITQSDNFKEERMYLRLQIRGVVYKIATGILKKELIIKIPLDEVPQGIAEVTLFDANAIPVAERLVFINQDQKLTIQTELIKSEFFIREKANLKIKVTDENGHPVVLHLGLSVYDAIYQNKIDSKNIQSHYLLSTQLKGAIYNPEYYFDEKNKDRKEALNLLLLTQGWRNYVWNESNLNDKGNINTIFFEEIKGKVHLVKPDKKTTTESLQKPMMVFAADENRGKEFMMTDTSGLFTIGYKDLKKGEGGFTYVKLITPEKPKYQMVVKDYSFETINNERKNKTKIYPLSEIKQINPKEVSPFIGRESINKLKEVVITSKKNGITFRDKYIGKLDSLARVQSPTSDYVGICGTLNCPLHEFESGNTKPIEGVEYEEMIGFKRNGNNYTVEGYKRQVYHYPKLTEAEVLEKFNIAMIEGIYGKKVFYEAVYDEVTLSDPLPDYRNTLFWKSDIITDEKGEANVDFFCSDINSLFLVNIEGVSGDGLFGTKKIEFKVRKKEN